MLALFDDLPVVEPAKRMVGGRFGWAVHRFPIVGGRKPSETIWRGWSASIAANVAKNNALFDLLLKRAK